ncbi:uncharacterized protein LOC117234231 [Bombus vosnesenskii]|uniref:Uncharacterized protein LOC117234231 n=2 Tax=Pyrobombus TaxID=144703 RepID=A0A6J3KD98_9HYME|nr:uncharacterized protein LOC117163247 [Bombus vancouverensis nearcticus]XP_033314874.1 uncharacterized protein LOC117213554 [Bombus bifarius]XP_033351118.1 uncharacterized protein LOC117234231 [Bombus vosnesenskii]
MVVRRGRKVRERKRRTDRVKMASKERAESIPLTVLNADIPGWLTSRGCFLCQHSNIEAGRSCCCHIRQSQLYRWIINPAVYITTPLSSRVTLPPFFAAVFQKPRTLCTVTLEIPLLVI